MRIMVRRHRRRRTGSDVLGFTQSRFSAPFFDRLVYLSQSIHQPRKTDAPFIILVSQDNFLRSGFARGPAPLNNCWDVDTLDAALNALQNWPLAKLLVDIESPGSSLFETLDQLRRAILYPPLPTVSLLIRADDYDRRLFCQAAGPVRVLERQLSASMLHQALQEPPPAPSNRSEWFSREEWAILQHLALGESLKHIALLRQLPYSRVVYRIARIVSKLGLNHRHELLHLLHRLTDRPA